MHGTYINGVDRKPPGAIVPAVLSPAGSEIIIRAFNGFIRELRYFSDCLDSSMSLKLAHQKLNS